jgi:serine protease Do
MYRSKIYRVILGAVALSFVSSVALAAGGAMTPREIYKTTGKGVVLVFGTDGSAQGSAGTGSIITEDGQIITNAHVVAKDGRPYKRLFVYLKPAKLRGSMRADLKHRFEAKLVDIDHDLDLALLKMKSPPKDLTAIPFVDPDEVEIGEPVIAIGHPETGGLWTLTTGVISSVVADFQGVKGKNVFQTEASINRGNSGGPLLNAYGQMIGINTCISRRAADGLAITDINFSLKSSVPVEWMKRRELMTLAYVKPGDANPAGDMAVAAVTPSETKAKPSAAVPEKPAAVKAPPKKPDETLKSDDGKITIAVHEPEEGEEVASDPEWEGAVSGGESITVSSGRSIKGASKKAKRKAKRAAKRKAPKEKKAKILTKRRPFKLDPFVAKRIKEIKALEDMMDEMSNKIRKKSGQKKKKSKGMGLW